MVLILNTKKFHNKSQFVLQVYAGFEKTFCTFINWNRPFYTLASKIICKNEEIEVPISRWLFSEWRLFRVAGGVEMVTMETL